MCFFDVFSMHVPMKKHQLCEIFDEIWRTSTYYLARNQVKIDFPKQVLESDISDKDWVDTCVGTAMEVRLSKFIEHLEAVLK